jgi:hypothetical protein
MQKYIKKIICILSICTAITTFAIIAIPSYKIYNNIPIDSKDNFLVSSHIKNLNFPTVLIYNLKDSIVRNVTLYESDNKFGLRGANYEQIRDIGNGIYRIHDNVLQFSTSDNSDPLTNGRIYSISIRLIPSNIIFILFIISIIIIEVFIFQIKNISKYIKILHCIFGISILIIFMFRYIPNENKLFTMHNDTLSYIFTPTYDNFFTNYRSEGYPIFLNIFLSKNDISNIKGYVKNNPLWDRNSSFIPCYREKRAIVLKNSGLAEGLIKASYVQRLLLYSGIICVFLSLYKLVNIWSIVILSEWLTLKFNRIFIPESLLSESLAIPMLMFISACILLYCKSKQWRYLILSSILSSIAFLIRPSCAFTVVIVGSLVLYALLSQRQVIKKVLPAFLCCCIFLALSAIYVLKISIYAGTFVPGLVYTPNANQFSLYLLEQSDINYIKNERVKVFAQTFIDSKQEINHLLSTKYKVNVTKYKTDKPNFEEWITLGAHYAHVGFDLVLNKVGYRPDIKQSKELFRVVTSNHRLDYFILILGNIKASLGQNDNMHFSNFAHNNIEIKLYIMCMILIIISIITGLQNLRLPILVITSFHLVHIILVSISIPLQSRFVYFTEWYMIIAFCLSIYSLLLMMIQNKYKKFIIG